MPCSVPEVPLTLSESHQSDGFLWPGALAVISFLPLYQPRLPPPRLKRGFGSLGRVELLSQSLFRKSPLWPVGVWLSSVCVLLASVENCGDEAWGTLGQRKIDVGAAIHSLLIPALFLSLFLQSWPQ